MSAGSGGGKSDSRMFAESLLYTDINEGGYLSHGEYLLCDSGYTCSKFTINVVPNKRITHVEKQFNKAHRIARSCIERAFGQLKGRWRRLTSLDFNIPNGDAVMSILVACILHNFCQSRGEEAFEPIEDDDDTEHVGDDDLELVYERDTSIRNRLIAHFE